MSGGKLIFTSCYFAGGDHSHQRRYRLVFLGLALDKQNKDEEARKAYTEAAKIKPDDALAWQGLVSLCEGQNGKLIDDYHTAAVRLAEIFVKAYGPGPSGLLAKTDQWILQR